MPAGTLVLDLGDSTLLPGLMDLHTHLTIGSTGPRQRRRMMKGGAVYRWGTLIGPPEGLDRGVLESRGLGLGTR